MAAGGGVRSDVGLRSGVGPVRRALATAVQGGQVAGRHWLGVGMQEGSAGSGRPNAPAHVGVSRANRRVIHNGQAGRSSLRRSFSLLLSIICCRVSARYAIWNLQKKKKRENLRV